MPISIPKASMAAIASLKLALFGANWLIKPCWRNESNRYRNGRISGRKFIYSLQFIRSPSAIDCKDKILFIEDLDEFYHIDRMMMN
jgi:muramoyltetrapeptide carboxypeptidase